MKIDPLAKQPPLLLRRKQWGGSAGSADFTKALEDDPSLAASGGGSAGLR